MGVVAIDCFCGCGGTTRGFLNAGIHVVKGIDSDEGCRATFETNNSPAKFVCRDIYDVSADDLLEDVVLDEGDHLLLAGCAPCQPFSKHQKEAGDNRERSLLMQFGRLVESVEPEFVFVENVPGIQRVAGNSTFSRFRVLLERAGYSYDYGVLNAVNYGVPQSRARLILVASRSWTIRLPEPSHGSRFGLRPIRTVREAIAHFPRIRAGHSHRDVPNHAALQLSELNMKRIRATPRNGGDRRAWPKSLTLDCHKGSHDGHTDVYGRMAWDKPAPALTCRCASLSNGRYGHPAQHRAISLREAAALQTFDDDFVFDGSIPSISRQIGNAVPVLMAEKFGELYQSYR